MPFPPARNKARQQRPIIGALGLRYANTRHSWRSNRAFNNKRQPETENSVFRLPSLQIIQAAQRQPESSTTSNYH
ncbi:hypothetical protein [Kingella oralis]|uniref:hypothetical protein n=1 Tax=Kingella oralis TaxID=505 RepID=UPI0034E3A038